MKQKQIKQQKTYKKRRLILVCILALLTIALIIGITKNTKLSKIALDQNSLNIGGEVLDLSNVLSNEPNPPHLGAGMIPIKWDSGIGSWVITTANDTDWYDYSKGKWANVMLSDGYYKSELERGITEDQLATKSVGATIGRPEDLGTIFTWIPRLAYSEDHISFLKGTSIVEYIYKTEECFNLEKYGANALDLAFEGIWVGQAELASTSQVEQKNNEMNTEENTYGLIANEKVQTLTNSDKIAIHKLYEKTVGDSVPNNTVLNNIDTMQNRQTIKIVNTNKRVPISGTHEIVGDNIIVGARYNENKIAYCTDKDGNRLNENSAPISEEEVNYTFYIVDEMGNIKKYNMNYGGGKPYLKGFNKNNTFYVVYNEGVPDTSIPIGEKAPANWYDYDNQMWANIVCRENGQEIYYTWIPRYVYKLDNANQSVEARIVDLENKDIKTGEDLNNTEYKLPEAFSWGNDGNKAELTGYWISKYKLRDNSTYNPDIYGLGGTVVIEDVVSHFGSSYTYEAYLIKDGKRLVKNEEGKYVEGTEPVIITGNYKFTKVPAGEYIVNIILKDSAGNDIQGIAKNVTVEEKIPENKPNLSKYDINNTFYVVYDSDGNETSYEPIGNQNQDEVQNWYDYDEDKKATIVVKDFGEEIYYEWIPRYQCLISDSTRLSYIPTTKTEPDAGYTIPSEFTGENAEGYWKQKASYTNRVQANISAGKDKILLTNITLPSSATKYDIYLIQNGKIIKQEENITENTYSYTNLEKGRYTVEIIVKDDAEKTLAGYAEEQIVTDITVDLTGFSKLNTFYVVYDENGKVDSSIPIGEKAPDNWYDYAEQKWANIVCREDGQELYYTYIPRYEYKLNNGLQKTKAMFTSQETADNGYQIPEAFTWVNPESADEKVQLPGYWISKYKLRDNSTYNPDIYGLGGTIVIDGVTAHFGNSYTYEVYLVNSEGKRIVKNAEENYAEGIEPVTITENYKFTKLSEGNYTVNVIIKDGDGNEVMGIAKTVEVLQKTTAHKPDLSEFSNKNTTFFVTYNALGTENESVTPIGQAAPDNWYDYDEDKKATIVIRENGVETYYEWIPRYQYQNGHTDWVSYISKEQLEADEGYTLPSEFQNNALEGYWKETAKYTNRMYANIAAGEDNVIISNIQASTNSLTYNVYLIKDGIIQNHESTISTTYTFSNLSAGAYGVLITQKDTALGILKASYLQEVNVGAMEVPDVTGYMVDTTYLVLYDGEGNEDISTTVRSVLKDGATINEDGALVEGEIDLNKINGKWYDYAEQRWANIVTKNDGKTFYFTWIPRYEYMLDNNNQATYARFIPKTQITGDSGYQIPESFTWNGEPIAGYWISKYKLRD